MFGLSQILNELQQHLVFLKQDLQLLEKYRDEGVPSHLGLGLYRADLYIPKLKALIPKKSSTSKTDKTGTCETCSYYFRQLGFV